MKRPGDSVFKRLPAQAAAVRPGKVADLRGIIFQSDGSDLNGRLFIRPIEAFDRWQAGLSGPGETTPLAMHAGLHVVLEDGRQFVAEQLVGSLFEDFDDGLNWTPLDAFRQRDRGGWDATVPPVAFRAVDETAVRGAITFLNAAKGRPFVGEDCTRFIERAFGGRRLFGDSPTGLSLGLGLRIGDPALPLLRTEVALDARAMRLLRVKQVSAQPDPLADHAAPNARLWLGRIIVWSVLGLILVALGRLIVHRVKPRRRRWRIG